MSKPRLVCVCVCVGGGGGGGGGGGQSICYVIEITIANAGWCITDVMRFDIIERWVGVCLADYRNPDHRS